MRVHNLGDKKTSLEDCAQQIYNKAWFSTDRLSSWPADNLNYNSLHQVIALAMATKRTGLGPQDYLSKYLYIPAGMSHTVVYPLQRPLLSAFMMTTVEDYDSFLL